MSLLFHLDPRKVVEGKMVRIAGGWSCKECLYTSKYTTDVRRHVESKHMHHFSNCDLCSVHFPNFVQLKQHYILCHVKEYS